MELMPAESISIPLLLVASGLLLLLGVIAIAVITIVARRCNTGDCGTQGENLNIEHIDAWKEAGKRVNEDFNEHE
jgi:hypothetical protein